MKHLLQARARGIQKCYSREPQTLQESTRVEFPPHRPTSSLTGKSRSHHILCDINRPGTKENLQSKSTLDLYSIGTTGKHKNRPPTAEVHSNSFPPYYMYLRDRAKVPEAGCCGCTVLSSNCLRRKRALEQTARDDASSVSAACVGSVGNGYPGYEGREPLRRSQDAGGHIGTTTTEAKRCTNYREWFAAPLGTEIVVTPPF